MGYTYAGAGGNYPTGTNEKVIGAPSNLAGLDVDSGMLHETLDQNLRLQMTLDDVFSSFSSETIKDTSAIQVGNEVFLTLGAGAPKGTNSITIGITQPLSGTVQVGDAYIPGTELEATLRYYKMFYGEYAIAMKSQAFGRIANEMDFYKVYEKQTPMLAHFASELKGQRIREALLNQYDTITALDNSLTTTFNTNVYVVRSRITPNTTANNHVWDGFAQPAWDTGSASVKSTWDDAVNETLISVDETLNTGTGAQTRVEDLRTLSYYAKYVKRIEPMANGKYVLLLPNNVLKALKNNEAGMAGNVFWNSNDNLTDELNYTFKVGEVDDLIIYSDSRFPTITADARTTASTSTAAMNIKFVEPGNVDARNVGPYLKASNKAFSVGYLLGRAAIAEWDVTPIHSETDTSNYGKRKGNGIFGESGYGAISYDNDTGWTDAGQALNPTRLNIGSIAVFFPNPSI